jgi:hypothetical protein
MAAFNFYPHQLEADAFLCHLCERCKGICREYLIKTRVLDDNYSVELPLEERDVKPAIPELMVPDRIAK